MSGDRVGDLGPRIRTILIFVPIVLAAVFLGNWVFTLLVLLLAVGVAEEMGRLLPNREPVSMRPAQVAIIWLFVGTFIVSPIWLILTPFFLFLSGIGDWFKGDASWARRTSDLGWQVFTACYAGLALWWVYLRFEPDGLVLFLFALAVTWFNDTVAYLGGSRFGRKRLVPALSPKKSVEGALFGLGAGGLVGLVFTGWLPLHPGVAIALGVITAISAQLGDLFASMLKRGAEVKDTGALLPGHGGLLDRVDSLLFSVPVVLLLVRVYVILGGTL